MNPGSSQEGLCPLGGYMEGDSTPNLCVILQNDGLTFFARDCHNTGLQSLHHNFWQWELWRRIKKTTRESSTSFLSLDANHWCGSQRAGSSAVFHPRSSQHQEAASECGKCCYNPLQVLGCHKNIKLLLFQHALK